MKEYHVNRVTETPAPGQAPPDPFWDAAEVAAIDWYHQAGSEHRPEVSVQLLYDGAALWVRFSVVDRYVRCLHTNYQDPVYEDSCCEVFLEPTGVEGYFNIEMNAIGSLMISQITDPTRSSDGFVGQRVLGSQADRRIRRWTTLSGVIDPELPGPLSYEVAYTVPFTALHGALAGPEPGDRWSGNFYKCSENSSHPHWGAWSPIGEKLEYHQPARFGLLWFQ